MSNYITEKAISQGVEVMVRLDRERTREQHEKYVRALIYGVREHLVQRHLYDQITRQYNHSQSEIEPPRVPCPCGEPSPIGAKPCTFAQPCVYGQGKPKERWA